LQILGQILGIIEISLILTTNVMWVLSYASPELLGTCFGIYSGCSGLFQVLFNICLPLIIDPLSHPKYTTIFIYVVAGTLAVTSNMALVIWIWYKGLPSIFKTNKIYQ